MFLYYRYLFVFQICDADLNILNINARFPGSNHDSAIWSLSSAKRLLQQQYTVGDLVDSWLIGNFIPTSVFSNFIITFLLGDSGYPLEPWLMTPIVNAMAGTPEANYTNMHTRSRNTIERVNGVLKQRFRCLGKALHYKPQVAARITYACAILHNICTMMPILL